MKEIILVLILASLSCCSRQQESYILNKYKTNNISIKIKNHPKRFYVNKKYWLSIEVDSLPRDNRYVYMTNGLIKLSEDDKYDYVFIPEQVGKFKIIIVGTSYLGAETFGEIEIIATPKKE